MNPLNPETPPAPDRNALTRRAGPLHARPFAHHPQTTRTDAGSTTHQHTHEGAHHRVAQH